MFAMPTQRRHPRPGVKALPPIRRFYSHGPHDASRLTTSPNPTAPE